MLAPVVRRADQKFPSVIWDTFNRSEYPDSFAHFGGWYSPGGWVRWVASAASVWFIGSSMQATRPWHPVFVNARRNDVDVRTTLQGLAGGLVLRYTDVNNYIAVVNRYQTTVEQVPVTVEVPIYENQIEGVVTRTYLYFNCYYSFGTPTNGVRHRHVERCEDSTNCCPLLLHQHPRRNGFFRHVLMSSTGPHTGTEGFWRTVRVQVGTEERTEFEQVVMTHHWAEVIKVEEGETTTLAALPASSFTYPVQLRVVTDGPELQVYIGKPSNLEFVGTVNTSHNLDAVRHGLITTQQNLVRFFAFELQDPPS